MISRVYGSVGERLEFKGTAYDFGHAVTAVEFSLDEGAHWTAYRTETANDYQYLTWAFAFVPDREGLYRMLVRSVNDCGEASPVPATIELEIG